MALTTNNNNVKIFFKKIILQIKLVLIDCRLVQTRKIYKIFLKFKGITKYSQGKVRAQIRFKKIMIEKLFSLEFQKF